MTAIQPRTPRRRVTLDPFDLGAPAREDLAAASPFDVGCVDWYLYPVAPKARPMAHPRSARRGAGAAPCRENPAA
jgi:hypothetical protein